MISNSAKYEWQLIKKRKYIFLAVGIFMLVALILIYFIPNTYYLFSKLGYPDNITTADMLADYEKEVQSIYTAVANGEYPLELKVDRLKILDFYISTNTCEYDYIQFQNLINRYAGSEELSFTLALLEGTALLNILWAVGLSNYFISYPYNQNYLRQMIASGEKRQRIFRTKNLIGLFILGLALSLVSIVSLFILKPYYGHQVLMRYNDSFIAIPLVQIVASIIIGLYLSGAFYYLFSEFIGLLSKKVSWALIFPIFLFVICFVGGNTSIPALGNYGQLTGIGKYLLLLIPFSNIVMASTLGLEWEIIVLFAFYLIIDMALYFANRFIFRRIRL